MACACGPMMAMDFSGPAAKVSPTTSVSQPATTSMIAPGILATLVVIEVLNPGTPGLEVAHDVDQTVNPSLQARPAEAGFCVEIEREQFHGILDVELGVLWRDHRDHDLAIARD